jgi:hypothetical protein
VANAAARDFAARVLALQMLQPDLTPLELLDHAMKGRDAATLDFGTLADGADCLVDPATPFGALVAAAFDEQVTFSGLRTLGSAREPNAFEIFWFERVMKAFRRRYGGAV